MPNEQMIEDDVLISLDNAKLDEIVKKYVTPAIDDENRNHKMMILSLVSDLRNSRSELQQTREELEQMRDNANAWEKKADKLARELEQVKAELAALKGEDTQ